VGYVSEKTTATAQSPKIKGHGILFTLRFRTTITAWQGGPFSEILRYEMHNCPACAENGLFRDLDQHLIQNGKYDRQTEPTKTQT
jgi:hypothetical protein